MRVFRKMGIDIVHLAEFHYGDTPRKNEAERLNHLEHLHAECQRLSDENFLLLPGEEPNVHLGGQNPSVSSTFLNSPLPVTTKTHARLVIPVGPIPIRGIGPVWAPM